MRVLILALFISFISFSISLASEVKEKEKVLETAHKAKEKVLETATVKKQKVLDDASKESQEVIATAARESKKLINTAARESKKLINTAARENKKIIASAQKANECAGTAAFKTAKDVFHKTPINHADASLIAYSSEKGKNYGKKLFLECVNEK